MSDNLKSNTRADIIAMIKINEGQRDIAKCRKEFDVVVWHQKIIDSLYLQLDKTK